MRAESSQPGIRTWHEFSAGAHYDPDNLSFGPLVGLDEHLVEPGAGFDWHAHAGVVIASWVLEGTLLHQGPDGDEQLVGPGVLLVQSTADGIRHRETNASDADPLRFMQVTLLGDDARGVRTLAPPASVGPAVVEVIATGDVLGPGLVHDLASGDAVRLATGESHTVGAGALVIRVVG